MLFSVSFALLKSKESSIQRIVFSSSVTMQSTKSFSVTAHLQNRFILSHGIGTSFQKLEMNFSELCHVLDHTLLIR